MAGVEHATRRTGQTESTHPTALLARTNPAAPPPPYAPPAQSGVSLAIVTFLGLVYLAPGEAHRRRDRGQDGGLTHLPPSLVDLVGGAQPQDISKVLPKPDPRMIVSNGVDLHPEAEDTPVG